MDTRLPPFFLISPLSLLKCVRHRVKPSELIAYSPGVSESSARCKLSLGCNRLIIRTKRGTRGGASCISFEGPGIGRGSTLSMWAQGRSANVQNHTMLSGIGPGPGIRAHQGSSATAFLTGNLPNPSGGPVDKRCNNVPPPKLCPTSVRSSTSTLLRHESSHAIFGSTSDLDFCAGTGGGPSSVYRWKEGRSCGPDLIRVEKEV
jgi:hypothetical protein